MWFFAAGTPFPLPSPLNLLLLLRDFEILSSCKKDHTCPFCCRGKRCPSSCDSSGIQVPRALIRQTRAEKQILCSLALSFLFFPLVSLLQGLFFPSLLLLLYHLLLHPLDFHLSAVKRDPIYFSFSAGEKNRHVLRASCPHLP
jgi:hypothetical protein